MLRQSRFRRLDSAGRRIGARQRGHAFFTARQRIVRAAAAIVAAAGQRYDESHGYRPCQGE
jgi:hypothetical protein